MPMMRVRSRRFLVRKFDYDEAAETERKEARGRLLKAAIERRRKAAADRGARQPAETAAALPPREAHGGPTTPAHGSKPDLPLAHREPPLWYLVVPHAAEKKVSISFWRAGRELRRRGDVIAEGTITDFDGPYPRLPKAMSSKDASGIDRLPEAIRDNLIMMDADVRALLKATTRRNARRRLRAKSTATSGRR